MTGEVVALRTRAKAKESVDEAIASGRPLPLVVMLEAMWSWYEQAQSLKASDHPDDRVIRRLAMSQAQRAAEAAAPYVHPKLSNTMVGGDPENPVRLATAGAYARLTDEQATRFLEALNSGTMTIEQVHAAVQD